MLGLTATATMTTAVSVARHLGISDSAATIRGAPIPSNLKLSVSSDGNREQVTCLVCGRRNLLSFFNKRKRTSARMKFVSESDFIAFSVISDKHFVIAKHRKFTNAQAYVCSWMMLEFQEFHCLLFVFFSKINY